MRSFAVSAVFIELKKDNALLVTMYFENGKFRYSEQEKMDRRKCRPGYRWMELPFTKKGGKCMPGGYGGGIDLPEDPGVPLPPLQPDNPPAPQPPADSANGAIAQEKRSRMEKAVGKPSKVK